MNKSQIVYLTVLRGIASLWVGLHHAIISFKHMNTHSLKILSVIAYKGWLGVDLFFILSGFILAYAYQNKVLTFNWQHLWDFFVNRLIRILPVHFFVMLTFGGIVAFLIKVKIFKDVSEQFTLNNFLEQFFLLHGIGLFFPQGWNVPTWSISSELLAYSLFPLFFLVAVRINSIWKEISSLIFIFVGTVILGWFLNNGTKFMLDYHLTSVRVLSEFLMGILLYRLYIRVKKHSLFLLPAILALCCLILQPFFITNSFYDFLYLIYFLVIIFCLALVPRVHKIPFFCYLGEISYSFYLIHSITIIGLNQLLIKASITTIHPLIILALFFALSLSAATILYEYVEVPAKKILSHQWQQFSFSDLIRKPTDVYRRHFRAG